MDWESLEVGIESVVFPENLKIWWRVLRGTKNQLEISRASKKLKRSVKEIVNEENPVDELKDASKSIGKTIAAESFESVRKMEKFIYEKIMLKFTPYYFDTEDLSINLEKKGKDRYILNVNIMDEKIRNKIKEKIGKNKEDII